MLLRITHNDWIMSESIADLQLGVYVNQIQKCIGFMTRAVSSNGVPASCMRDLIHSEGIEYNIGKKPFTAQELEYALEKTSDMYFWIKHMWDQYLNDVENKTFHGTWVEYTNKMLLEDKTTVNTKYRLALLDALSATITELEAILDNKH